MYLPQQAGINIAPNEVDLATAVGNTVDQLRATHPDRCTDLEVKDNVQGV